VPEPPAFPAVIPLCDRCPKLSLAEYARRGVRDVTEHPERLEGDATDA